VPVLPAARLVLWRAGATAEALARVAADLGGARAGLCAEDFDLTPDAVRAAFGSRALVLYRRPD
jgi:hypothetical protein